MISPKERRPVRRASKAATTQAVLAIAAAGATALLANAIEPDGPGAFDRAVRRDAQSPRLRKVRPLLSPLFPFGLPITYMTTAYATARWLRARNQGGGPAIVSSALLGWLTHRLATMAYSRERPRRPRVKRRMDSYPSGHTTGVTAVALTSAYVLGRERVISTPQALGVAVIPPAIMGAYRVLADAHWMTDVFGGWLLGGSVALACNAILADRPRATYTTSSLRHARRERQTSEG